MSAKYRYIRTAIAALLVGVLLLCVFFIVAEGNHHCSGDECVVCACIRLCERTLHPIAGLEAAWACLVPAASILIAGACLLTWSLWANNTPIFRKVRIND